MSEVEDQETTPALLVPADDEALVNAPVGLDPSRPNVARVYDYLLGGKDNYESDRSVAERIIREMPAAREVAWENRNFLIRVCRFLVNNTGVRQFLDLGSGLPTAENVHQVVQRKDPTAKVLYVDYDEVIAAHGRNLLVENDNTEFLQADIFDPEAVLGSAEARQLFDWSRPIAVLAMAALHHHVGSRGRPAEVMKQYIERLPSGSYVAISHVLDPRDGSDDDVTLRRALESIHASAMRDVTARTREEIRALFGGLDLIPSNSAAPRGEVVGVGDWWSDGPRYVDTIAHRIIAGAVAFKP